MTRPNITPGPWINNADTVYMGQKPAFLAVCSPWNHPQSVANARAIAAVPALLEALELLFTAYEGQTKATNGDELSPFVVDEVLAMEKAKSALTAAGYQS